MTVFLKTSEGVYINLSLILSARVLKSDSSSNETYQVNIVTPDKSHVAAVLKTREDAQNYLDTVMRNYAQSRPFPIILHEDILRITGVKAPELTEAAK